MTEPAAPSTSRDRVSLVLLAAVFCAAISGLLYELVAGALASYLLGDSITQFSIVIGLFLTAMGLGAWLSRFVERHLVSWLVGLELFVGVVGGLAALVGFVAFAFTELYPVVLGGSVLLVGAAVGAEIPLVLRILKDHETLKISVSNVLCADYVGALVASIAFPYALLPHLGLTRAGVLAGVTNALVALVLSRARLAEEPPLKALQRLSWAAVVGLGAVFVVGGSLTDFVEEQLYQDEIVLAETSPVQRIIITRHRGDLRLFLNGHLQFSSIDEHRYHESLVFPAMAAVPDAREVLILGGGDGLAARTVLQHPGVQRVTLVDLDPSVTTLFQTHPLLTELNGGALNDPRVEVVNEDAMRFLDRQERGEAAPKYDVIIVDLPDPSEPGLAKLYSRAFYRLCATRLSEGGALVTQATSPFRARKAFWGIVHTLEATTFDAGQGKFSVAPYHSYIPTFGTWGFVLATKNRVVDVAGLKPRVAGRFLTADVLPGVFVFPPDLGRVDAPVTDLDDPAVVSLYHDGYHRYLD